jgi:hypothetical protein
MAIRRPHEDSFKVGNFDRGIILDCHHVYSSFFTSYIKGVVMKHPRHKRITIWIGSELQDEIRKLLDYETHELVINRNIIQGLVKTDEKIEITMLMDDEDRMEDEEYEL